jgi:hypothetical protein
MQAPGPAESVPELRTHEEEKLQLDLGAHCRLEWVSPTLPKEAPQSGVTPGVNSHIPGAWTAKVKVEQEWIPLRPLSGLADGNFSCVLT